MAKPTFDDAVADFTHAVGLLVRRSRTAAGSHDLSLTEWAVLSRLAREGPATTAELARAEGIKPQSMGTAVGTLEERGLVERTPHPTDGRQLNLTLTAQGVALRRSAREAKRNWLAQAIAHLDKADQATLFAAAAIIKRVVQA